MESQHKKMMQNAKKQNKKLQQMSKEKDTDAVDYKVSDSDPADNKLDLFLFSNQVDALVNSINQFDGCFPQIDLKMAEEAVAKAHEEAKA